VQATSTVRARGGLGVLAGEQEEVRHAGQQRRTARVDPVRVGDYPGVGGLPEHLGQPDPWHGVRGEQIPQHLTRADPVAPLVVNGRVYMLDSGGVAAYNARTGVRLWLNTSFSVITANLVIVGGLVLVSDTSCYSTSNYDGHVTALNAATGVEQWRSTGSWMIVSIHACGRS
jgi:outer membrane protein assembly factor BamB